MDALKVIFASLLLCATAGAQVTPYVPANTMQGNVSAVAAPVVSLTPAQVNTLLGTSQSIPAGVTLSQLSANYPATNYPNSTVVGTSDAGLVQSNGSTWVSGVHYSLLQTSIPFINAPSGTMNANCAFVLGTALDTSITYPTYAYITLPPNAIQTGSAINVYLAYMTSTTQGTCYQNTYTFGEPSIPATTTPWSTSTSGVGWTATTGGPLISWIVNVPAYAVGTNGRIEVKVNSSENNSTNNKGIQVTYQGTAIGPTDYETTATSIIMSRTMLNYTTKAQLNSGSSMLGTTGVTTNLPALSTSAVDTTRPSQMFIYLNKTASAADWQVLHSVTIDLYPSGPLDTEPTPPLTPMSASIVPPCAQQFGMTVSKWFLNPTAASVTLNPTSSSTSTPLYGGAGLGSAYYTTATVNGVTYLSVNQLGDGHNPNVITTNTAATGGFGGTLAPINAANGFYFEVAMTLTNTSLDHWSDVYANPWEYVGNGTYPYVEVDGDEQIAAPTAYNQNQGSTESTLNWSTGSGGSATSHNNLSLVNQGPAIDRSKEHIFGFGYSPTLQETFYCIDNRFTGFTVDTSGFNANITGKHYSVITGAQSHTVGAGGVPYSALIRAISAWSSQ